MDLASAELISKCNNPQSKTIQSNYLYITPLHRETNRWSRTFLKPHFGQLNSFWISFIMIVNIVRSFANINHLRLPFGMYFSMLALAPILHDVFIPVGTYHIRFTKDNLSITRTWWKLKGLLQVCVFTKLVLALYWELFFVSLSLQLVHSLYVKSLAAPHSINSFSEQDFFPLNKFVYLVYAFFCFFGFFC